MKRRLLALSLTVLALLAEATFASAQTTTPAPPGPPRTGSVAGQIVNGTAGGSVPADLKVMLHAWDATGETFMQEAAVDPAGAYRFEAVPMQTGWTFGVMLTRDDATYFSETAVYVVLYSLERFLLAFTSSYQMLAFGLTQSQIIALIGLAVSLPLIAWLVVRPSRSAGVAPTD